ncbi:MAG TPA: hypothetical protein VFY23_01160 [Candidatus Limnocylindrales bacterium]|nr:hypothetical protein [Candidatus Limnocylindrales bacterium]
MPRHDPPPEIVTLADARSAARRARDWETADRLKAEIEAAGWKVLDAASLYTLEPAAPPDVVEGGVVRYGSSASVPSRLEESPVGTASVVIVAEDGVEPVARTVRALVAGAPDGTQLVIVAPPSGSGAGHDPTSASPEAGDALDALAAADPGAPGVMTEVVRTAVPLGYAAALNAGTRRAAAPLVIVVRAGVEPRGDLVGGIATALADPEVAVAGPVGLVTDDLRRFEVAPTGATALDAIAGVALGFRREDYVERGPFEEQFTVPAFLDAWWSLVLRDLGEEDDLDAEPRRAVAIGGVTLDGVPDDALPGISGPAGKPARKAFYRYLKDFATRRDLLAGPAGDEVRARLRRLAGPAPEIPPDGA